MKKIYFIIIILLIGELQELNYQNVKYGEYIMQYALVKFIQNGNAHTIPCPDCFCFFTVKDNMGNTYLYNNRTVKIMDGLYGYAPNQNEINPGDYLLFTNCTSFLYGSETVMSNLKILDENYLTPAESLISNDTESNTCSSANTCSGISCIVPYLSCIYSKFTILVEIIDNLAGKILDIIQTITTKILNINPVDVLILFVWGIAVQIIGAIILIIAPLMVVFLVLFFILEIFVIAYVLFTSRENSSFGYIKLYVHGHYFIFSRIYMLFVSLVKMIPIFE